MMQTIKQKIYSLLKQSEKYTHTDMVYLAKGGSWLSFNQVFSSFSSFILAIAFANLLPKEIYGTYRYILSIVCLLTIPTLSGMSMALVQSVARGYEGSIYSAVKTKIKWGLLGGIASIILAVYYYFHGNTVLAISYGIAAIFIPFMDALLMYGPLLNGKKLFKEITKKNIFNNLIPTALIIITLLFTKNLLILLLIYFVGNSLTRSIIFLSTTNKIKPNEKIDHDTISYGKHLSVMDIIGTLYQNLDKILLFHYLGAADVAVYSFALAPVEQIKGLFKLVQPLAMPKFSEKSMSEIKKNILNKVIKFSIVALVLILIYILLAPIFYKLFFPKYLTSITFSRIYAFSLLPASSILTLTALNAQKAIKQLYQFNILVPTIQIISLFFFIYYFGLMGAIVAKIINRFMILFFSLYFIKKAN